MENYRVHPFMQNKNGYEMRSPASDAWVGAVVAACPPSAAPSSDDISAGATWGYLV